MLCLLWKDPTPEKGAQIFSEHFLFTGCYSYAWKVPHTYTYFIFHRMPPNVNYNRCGSAKGGVSVQKQNVTEAEKNLLKRGHLKYTLQSCSQTWFCQSTPNPNKNYKADKCRGTWHSDTEGHAYSSQNKACCIKPKIRAPPLSNFTNTNINQACLTSPMKG